MIKLHWIVLLLCICIASGTTYGVSLMLRSAETGVTQSVATDCIESYPFLNPYFACEKKPQISKVSLNAFRITLQEKITQLISRGDATHVSVYLVDLLNGPTLGINQNEQFQPASLLKLPILMAYYKLSEEKPDLLSQKLGYTGSLNTGSQVISEAHTIQPNTSYTVEDLLYKMIVYSDNRSKELLRIKLSVLSGDPNYLLNTYVNLGLIDLDQTDEETITVKMYSSLFRLLFNESFLTPHLSNSALNILANTAYDKGLVAGVPRGVKVSHKFGESGTNDLKQLHDCGIIYYENNPYSLCVMTRGKDPSKLEEIIASISSEVYREIDNRKIR